MKAAARRLKSALKKHGLSVADLARDAGLNVKTVRNVACGSSPSRLARQKITDRLGIRIWPAVHPKAAALSIPAGLRMRYPDSTSAADAIRSMENHLCVRLGRDIVFISDCRLQPLPAAARTDVELRGSDIEIVIDNVSPKQLAAARREHKKGSRQNEHAQ